jgi:hypothetical protein
MLTSAKLFLLIFIVFVLSGCVQTKYVWNGYDAKLYDYYKTPVESDQFMERLYEIILDGEPENRVPPGIYAEYGFMLYEKGKLADAVIWYRKEREKWPESKFLMDKMIALAGSKKDKIPVEKQDQQTNKTDTVTKETTP